MPLIRYRHQRPHAVLLLAGLLAWAACPLDLAKKKGPQTPPTPPVVVAATRAERTTVPRQLRDIIGIVEPYSTVQVRAQIEGPLLRVHFKEGQDVKTSDVLFTIDARPYVAALEQASANLERDQIRAENAKKEASRNVTLYNRRIVSEEDRDKGVADAAAIAADARADRAALEMAKVRLGYCTIRSPINGRTGSLKVHEGNLVKGEDVLVTIVQLSPIYVAFSVPEQTLPDIKKYMARGTLKVEASAEDDMRDAEVGEMTFVENTVDTTLGTIMLKGTFPNKDRTLWPGQFVNVALTLARQPDVVVVPAQAVQTGQENRYVFVVTDQSTVEERPVVVERTLDNQAIIAQGLQGGERVVTDGLLRLVAGAAVKVQESASASTGTLDSQRPSDVGAEKK